LLIFVVLYTFLISIGSFASVFIRHPSEARQPGTPIANIPGKPPAGGSQNTVNFLEFFIMRRIATLTAALAAAFAVTSAQALVLLVDDFAAPAVGVNVSTTPAPALLPPP
jgi:hypothetical protein